MYAYKRNEPIKPTVSANEVVGLIEDLVVLSVAKFQSPGNKAVNENLALVKRKLTDYFLQTDTRGGMYVVGPGDEGHAPMEKV